MGVAPADFGEFPRRRRRLPALVEAFARAVVAHHAGAPTGDAAIRVNSARVRVAQAEAHERIAARRDGLREVDAFERRVSASSASPDLPAPQHWAWPVLSSAQAW